MQRAGIRLPCTVNLLEAFLRHETANERFHGEIHPEVSRAIDGQDEALELRTEMRLSRILCCRSKNDARSSPLPGCICYPVPEFPGRWGVHPRPHTEASKLKIGI